MLCDVAAEIIFQLDLMKCEKIDQITMTIGCCKNNEKTHDISLYWIYETDKWLPYNKYDPSILYAPHFGTMEKSNRQNTDSRSSTAYCSWYFLLMSHSRWKTMLINSALPDSLRQGGLLFIPSVPFGLLTVGKNISSLIKLNERWSRRKRTLGLLQLIMQSVGQARPGVPPWVICVT